MEGNQTKVNRQRKKLEDDEQVVKNMFFSLFYDKMYYKFIII